MYKLYLESHHSNVYYCDSNNDPSLLYVCIDSKTTFANCSDGELRLVSGTDANEGRLEVCFNNAWGSVCNNQFTKEEAIVACYQLDPLYEPGTLSAVSN